MLRGKRAHYRVELLKAPAIMIDKWRLHQCLKGIYRQKLRLYKIKPRKTKTKTKENISKSNGKQQDLNQQRTATKRGWNSDKRQNLSGRD